MDNVHRVIGVAFDTKVEVKVIAKAEPAGQRTLTGFVERFGVNQFTIVNGEFRSIVKFDKVKSVTFLFEPS